MLYQQILYPISYFILYFKIYSINSVKQYHNIIHISAFPILYYPLDSHIYGHTVPPNDLRVTVKLVCSLSPTQWSSTGGEISTFSFTNQEGLDSVLTYLPSLGPNYLERPAKQTSIP